jgi:hypothetical protein
MGTLEVTLLREQGNVIGEDTQTYTARCAMPFFGYTGYEFTGSNTANQQSATTSQQAKKVTTLDAYNDTQKSYGMWFVPPDVGVTVLVVFIDGDPSQGYWIGCVPSRFGNHMVPGIAGSEKIDLDAADKDKYGVSKGPESLRVKSLPVAEANKRANKDQEIDVEKLNKPVHPIADRLLEQGLLLDDVRGVHTSTSRREAPSMVFGISSPGPLDKRLNAKKANIGTSDGQSPTPVAVSRLGGTTFIMDDGDERYVREKPASEGPQKYVDVQENRDKLSQLDQTLPYGESFRIRTRTGHQILLHNTEDLIYIGNARGTAWIEMTSNGKIDIFAKDSVSIHTETDFNFKADRDVNIEAGRNVNIKAETGRIKAECLTDFELLVNRDGKITIGGNLDILVGQSTKISQINDFEINTGGDNRFTATGDTSLGSGGNHKETAAQIHMNSNLPAEASASATPVKPFITHESVSTSTVKTWADARYQAGSIVSIMKRIPMHEPWLQHENFAPSLQTPDNTDRET